jgi:hypothetical protein
VVPLSVTSLSELRYTGDSSSGRFTLFDVAAVDKGHLVARWGSRRLKIGPFDCPFGQALPIGGQGFPAWAPSRATAWSMNDSDRSGRRTRPSETDRALGQLARALQKLLDESYSIVYTMSVSSRPGAAKPQVEGGFWRTGSRSERMCPAVVPRQLRVGRDAGEGPRAHRVGRHLRTVGTTVETWLASAAASK